ncbi:TonB-dependent receptor [Chitinophaga sp. Mgbs1]|uniref:TonB-dependent receptor n=1 Tax=Chitinophaga solisilvae TaxID=1233460 RepID=A0A433WMM8_9BACT|nr:TonB-dependent receptor [Chitinophaga solisilvae]
MLKHRTPLLFLLLLLFSAAGLTAQTRTGSITGSVSTADNAPLAFASVLMKDTRYGMMTDEKGHFSFDVPAGHYTLLVTYAGYVVTEKSVTIKSGTATDAGNLRIEAALHRLREVVVADIQKNKFANRQSATPARMPLGNLENPQAYSVIRKELMQEQVAIDYNTALISIPAAVVNNGVNESNNDIYMRGFSSQSTFRNGLATDSRLQTDIFNIEQVEILKGPSGTLFGGPMVRYGGIVNNITKKPFESFRGEVNYTTGSWGLNRFTVDINTPLNKDRTALARVNAFGHSQSSFQDYGYLRSFGGAVSLAFKPNERTTVRFDADITKADKNLNAFIRPGDGLTVKTVADLHMDTRRSLSSDDIGVPRTMVNTYAEIEYRLSDHWTSRTSYQHGHSAEKQSIFFVPAFINDLQIRRQFRIFENYDINTDNLQQNFTGDFRIGNVRNRIVAGLDYFARNERVQSMMPYLLPYDTITIHDAAWAPITRARIATIRNQSDTPSDNDISGERTYGVYVSDVVNISDRLMAMVSLRADWYESLPIRTNGISAENGSRQTQFSPKLGLVYQPVKDKVALFANYLNGFTNPAPSMDYNTMKYSYWKPEQANQWEAGVKLDLLQGKLSSTISYYDIRVKDKVIDLSDGTSMQDGIQDSKGIDIDIIANPVRGLNLVAGYGYNDNKYIRDSEEQQGKRAPWTPRHVANIWASYRFMDGRWQGFGIGIGANYADKVFFDSDEHFGVPAFTTMNGTLFYDQPKYRIGVKVNNLTNLEYWNFYGQPQKPRELLASVSYKF